MSNYKSNLSVLSFGEILWDIIDGQKYLGGAPLNFAAHVVKCGGISTLVSAIGEDDLGTVAMQRISALNVNASFVQRHNERPTGTVRVFLLDGQPDYTIHENVAFDYITQDGLNKISTGTYNTFYFGSLAQRSETSRATLQWILARHKFDHVFYDINLRKNYYSSEIVRYSLEQCTIFKINDDEVQTISALFYNKILSIEEFASRVRDDFKINLVIVTAGKHGCYIKSSQGFDYIPGVPVTVVDTVGAGDAFSAAFMYQYARNPNVVEAAVTGNKIGSYVAAAKGAIPEYSDAIKDFMS